MEHFCRKVCGFYLLDYRWVFIYASGLVFAYDMHIGKIILNFELENKIFYLSKHKSLFPHFFSKGTLLCSERGRGLWIPWISRLPPGDFGLFVFQISAFPPVYHFLNRNPNSTTFDHTNTPLLLPPWFFWNIYGLQKIIYIL